MENNTSDATIDLAKILLRVPEVVGEFERLICDIPYEDKGVLFSEMFLVYVAVCGNRPARIVEAGQEVKAR